MIKYEVQAHIPACQYQLSRLIFDPPQVWLKYALCFTLMHIHLNGI